MGTLAIFQKMCKSDCGSGGKRYDSTEKTIIALRERTHRSETAVHSPLHCRWKAGLRPIASNRSI